MSPVSPCPRFGSVVLHRAENQSGRPAFIEIHTALADQAKDIAPDTVTVSPDLHPADKAETPPFDDGASKPSKNFKPPVYSATTTHPLAEALTQWILEDIFSRPALPEAELRDKTLALFRAVRDRIGSASFMEAFSVVAPGRPIKVVFTETGLRLQNQ